MSLWQIFTAITEIITKNNPIQNKIIQKKLSVVKLKDMNRLKNKLETGKNPNQNFMKVHQKSINAVKPNSLLKTGKNLQLK